ncbi:hypothetical protein BT96DRAFT_886590 [Gymnopus androsaceus JB14]|uniref:GPI anchored protein n=1 Tax=Gymnopus androsaceus JB14 TaxID=1447944 RepID=A0A6A4H9K5_9AGAR|nr:hypothetical protein BT96DRAFT_886590 [Gymnopus androsaceus JB14]
MFATLVTVTLFAAVAINGAAAQLTISTPTLTTCEPIDFTWTDSASGPYDLILVSPADPCGDAIVDLGVIDGTSVSYTPELAPGTQLEGSLIDADGNEAWTATMTIVQGSNSSCIPASLLSSASSTAISSSAASSSATSSSTDATTTAVAGTTLVVTGDAATVAESNSASATGPAEAVGSNAPLGASKGSSGSTKVNAPIMILSAIAGVIAFSL